MGEHIAFIGLGSNLNDRPANLVATQNALAGVLTIQRASSLYETEPVDVPNQPWFLNQILVVKCTYSPFDLLKTCLTVEQNLGRVRRAPKGPRTIDLDILLYDELVLDEERDGLSLVIPHPRLHLRKFVLVPLCELAPHHLHPVFKQTMGQLLTTVVDPSLVRLYLKL